MRTRIEVYNSHGFVGERYATLGTRELTDDIEVLLGAEGLVYIEIVKKGGNRIIYHAPEYECEICESYGHKDQDCPWKDEADDTGT